MYLLKDIGTKCNKQTVLYCDSQRTIHIASNPVFHKRRKYLKIDCHFVREKVQRNVLKLLPISTQEQVADFFTKPLDPPKFENFVSKLGMIDIYHGQAYGGC